MRAAIVDGSGDVLNVIVVDGISDPAPSGCRLVQVPDGLGIDTNWKWSQSQGLYDPRPAPVHPTIQRAKA